jgi:hypothetical protein
MNNMLHEPTYTHQNLPKPRYCCCCCCRPQTKIWEVLQTKDDGRRLWVSDECMVMEAVKLVSDSRAGTGGRARVRRERQGVCKLCPVTDCGSVQSVLDHHGTLLVFNCVVPTCMLSPVRAAVGLTVHCVWCPLCCMCRWHRMTWVTCWCV